MIVCQVQYEALFISRTIGDKEVTVFQNFWENISINSGASCVWAFA